MADTVFESAWLKWGWAVREAKALQDEIYAFAADEEIQGLNATTCDYDSKRHGFILRVAATAPLSPRIGLRLGVTAHGFRSALDNLAWALVSRGSRPPATLTPRERRRVAFPICEEKDGPQGFTMLIAGTKKQPSVLPGVNRFDLATIRRAQPYTRGKTNVPFHVLAVLADLNNADKHRSIQPVRFLPEIFRYEITEARECEVTRSARRARRRILQVGTELAYFGVRKTGPNPYIHVEYEMATFPAVHERLGLWEWLRQAVLVVGGIIGSFSDPPEAELAKFDLPPANYWISHQSPPTPPAP